MALKSHRLTIDTAGATKSHWLVTDTAGATINHRIVIDTAYCSSLYDIVVIDIAYCRACYYIKMMIFFFKIGASVAAVTSISLPGLPDLLWRFFNI